MQQIALLTLISLTTPVFATNRNANATASAAPVSQSADTVSAAADEKTASAARFGLTPATATVSNAGIPNGSADGQAHVENATAARQKAALQIAFERAVGSTTGAYENYEVLQRLIDRGIDARAPIVKDGKLVFWPLVIAVQQGAVCSVATLLDAQAPCNLPTLDKPSPLQHAVQRCHNIDICLMPMNKEKCHLIIKMLLIAGANTEALEAQTDDYECFVVPALREVEQEKAQDKARAAKIQSALSECQSCAFPVPVANIVVQYTLGKKFMEYATELFKAAAAKKNRSGKPA